MSLLQFLVLCLAAGALVDVWFQGQIFAARRLAVRRRIDRGTAESVRLGTTVVPPFWARVLDCWYCLSHWVAAAVVAAVLLPSLWWPPLAPYLWLPVDALAVVRVLTLGNLLLPPALRFEADGPVTPNPESEAADGRPWPVP